MKKEEQKPGEGSIRKDFYAYLESQGLKMNDEIHAVVKKTFLEHARVQNDRMVKDRQDALQALHNVKWTSKDQTLIDRINEFRCPICGLKMKDRGSFEYVTECGHLPDIIIALA